MAEAPQQGCLIDGHHGWHGHAMMLDLAMGYGWPVDPVDLVVIREYDKGDGSVIEADIIYSLMTEAETWLNENIAPAGMSFGWHEGEFFYQPLEWWEEESG